jgi:hypothetical protein
MSYIDYYLVQQTGKSDFVAARRLAKANDEIEYYVESMIDVLEDRLDPDDGTEIIELDGVKTWVLQYHNGIGDGGSHDIANTEWVARDFPDVFKALGISVRWSKGPKVLAGQADGSA